MYKTGKVCADCPAGYTCDDGLCAKSGENYGNLSFKFYILHISALKLSSSVPKVPISTITIDIFV